MGGIVTAVGIEKKSEIKKHAATIHCSNSFTLLQRKISNALLYHAYEEMLVEEEHEISIRQLCNLISYHGNNHAAIKDALRGLLSTVLEWNLVNDTTGREDWTASSILASVSLQGPRCYYAYSPRMKQLLHSPTMFGKINLYIQSRFKSSYGLALYENCIRYRGLPHTKWFEISLFRKLMGVPVDNYPIFRDFKRRVLDKSVEEVNTYSDLIVEPELLRERRQVVKIRFLLKERAKKPRLGTQLLEDDPEVLNNLRLLLINRFNISLKQSQKIIANYDVAFIQDKIRLIEDSKNFQEGKVKNLAAYLQSALKNDYQTAKTSQSDIQQKKQEENRTKANLQEMKRLTREVEAAYMSYREQAIDTCIAGLDKNKKAYFLQMFHQSAETSIKTILKLQRKKYTRQTVMQSPQIRGLMREFALRSLPGLLSNLTSMDKFLEAYSTAHREAWYKCKLLEINDSIK